MQVLPVAGELAGLLPEVSFVPWGDKFPEVEKRAGSWPGRVPAPAPALVHRPRRPASVVDDEDRPVRVNGRGLVSAAPAGLSIANGSWIGVEHWSGPWPADERWWDPASRRRRARFQVTTTVGAAYLLSLESGSWWVEATYD